MKATRGQVGSQNLLRVLQVLPDLAHQPSCLAGYLKRALEVLQGGMDLPGPGRILPHVANVLLPGGAPAQFEVRPLPTSELRRDEALPRQRLKVRR